MKRVAEVKTKQQLKRLSVSADAIKYFSNELMHIFLHLFKHAPVNETVLSLTRVVIDSDYVQCI